MSCTCHLRINRPALREALGVRELLAASKVVGQITANVGVIWKHFTTSVYEGGDLPAIATREALQNSVDAIRAAVRARQIREGEGRFNVTWDPAARSLTWEDNGIGMDAETIQAKFLSLGDSGKREASGSSDEAAGGFGVAKAVILGVASKFQWELHTRDNLARPSEGGAVPIDDAPLRQGTRITVYDVGSDFDSWFDHARSEWVDLKDRLRLVLGACDLPGIALSLNGERVEPFFNRRGGSRIQAGSFGEGTTATVKGYRRQDRGGAYWIRLGGLYQFHAGTHRGRLPADVVIDLSTSIRPGERGYPLTASRTRLQGAADHAFDDLTREVEKESESAGRAEEYETYNPETASDEDPAAQEVRDGFAAALSDLDVRASFAEAEQLTGKLWEMLGRERLTPAPIDSAAPQGSRIEQDTINTDAPADPVHQAVTRLQGGTGSVEAVQVALAELAEQAMAPGGAGLISIVAQVVRAEAAVAKAAPAQAQRLRNPFGRFAGLRISKRNYDRDRARRFKNSFAKWVPYLVLWDVVLRMVAQVGKIRDRFYPGFVLDDSVGGLAAKGTATVVYIHPDRFKAQVKEFAQKPSAIAYYLHALACHELAHVEAGLGEGHGEEYVAKRENLGETTASLLGPIEEAVVQILKLPRRPPIEVRLRERCEEKLARCQGRRAPSPATPAQAWAQARVQKVRRALEALPEDHSTRVKFLPLLTAHEPWVVTQLMKWRKKK